MEQPGIPPESLGSLAAAFRAVFHGLDDRICKEGALRALPVGALAGDRVPGHARGARAPAGLFVGAWARGCGKGREALGCGPRSCSCSAGATM